MKKYEVNFLQYSKQQIVQPKNCNTIQFVNNGTSNVIINQSATIIPGASLNIEGNENEIVITPFNISFSGAGTNNCLVIVKTFV